MSTIINGLFTGEIQPTTNVCGCVDIYKNLWPDPLETIDRINAECDGFKGEAFWERAATIGYGENQTHRTNKLFALTNHARLSNNKSLQSIHNQFYMMLLATSIPYARRHGIEEPLWHEGYCALRYDGGEQYKAHYDSTTKVGRIISAICYLNDDYEGGELEFVNFGVKIKPEKGMLILFPSNFAYRHVAHPVISGSKYAIVTWLKDRDI